MERPGIRSYNADWYDLISHTMVGTMSHEHARSHIIRTISSGLSIISQYSTTVPSPAMSHELLKHSVLYKLTSRVLACWCIGVLVTAGVFERVPSR